MRRLLPFLLASMMLAGCSRPQGAGLWDLKLGGKARLIAEAGETEVELTDLVNPPAGGRRSSKKSTAQPKVETTKVAAGTTGVVLAIDGDDARFQIDDGPQKGTIHWVACKRLEPIAD